MTVALRLSGGTDSAVGFSYGEEVVLWGADELLWGADEILWGEGPYYTLGWGAMTLTWGYSESANTDPALSLGGGMSTEPVHVDIFGSVPSTAGTHYRCVYVVNDETGTDLKAWIAAETPSSNSTIAIGWGAAGLDAIEEAIEDDSIAPAGVTFASPTRSSEAVGIGAVSVGQYRALWIRLTVAGGATVPTERFRLVIK